ncbi:hypothetical protein HDU77_008674 [Chytriomyces hyalinus]|nr:hypothetical protein HDU77_008674 [Chytriomyces hyalinus]
MRSPHSNRFLHRHLEFNDLSGKFPCELSNLTALNDYASLDKQQQQSIAPIIGGVAGAAAVLGIMVAMGIWFHRKKRVKGQPASGTDAMQPSIGGDIETSTAFPLSSIPPSSEYSSVASERGAAVDDYLVARQAPQSITAPLIDRYEVFPYDQKSTHHQDVKVETFANLKASMPEQSAFVSENYMTAVDEKKALDQKSKDLSKSQLNLMLSSEGRGSSSSLLSLPADPKNWTEDETAEWILERFGNAQLSSLALSQKINGRALLMLERQDMKSELGLETFGERLLLDEAIAELRSQSAQQNLVVEENPPSYE